MVNLPSKFVNYYSVGIAKMKTIFITFSVTMAAVAVVASMFLNTILGAFGLAATSIGTLQKLQASQQVVQKMTERHAQKKKKAGKKLAERATRRLTSTVVAAATIGAVAVAATMMTFEIADYCDDKKELQEDANLLNGTQTVFNYQQCLEEGKEDSKAILSELKNSSVSAVSNAFSNTAQYSVEKWAAVKDAAVQALQSVGDASGGLWDSVKSWLTK